MKITYLELKNFASIYTGMKKKRIKIDFTKRKHRVTILVGETGSGKTSILSELNPFAYSLNDNRSSSELIMPDHDGYKEIHIENKDIQYIIKHHYHNKGERTNVKSFIMKNGEELNPNGNVTSFKEYVEKELKVTSDYMRLLRLGPNVETFIKMSTADRKYFISELLSEIGTYNDFYKTINENTKVSKTLLRTVSERIRRIGVDDPRILQASKEDAEEQLNLVKDELASIVGAIWTIRSNITHEKESMGKYASSYKEIPRLLTKTLSDRDKFLEEYNSIIGTSGRNLEEYEASLNMSALSLDAKMKNVQSTIDQLLIEEMTLSNEKVNKEEMIRYSSSDDDYKSIEQEIETTILLKESGNKEFANSDKYPRSYNSDDLKTGLGILMEIHHIILDIYEFDRVSVNEVMLDVLNGGSVSTRVSQEIHKIDHKIESIKSSRNASNKLEHSNHTYVIVEPEGHEDCPYKELFESSIESSYIDEDNDVEKITNLENERERYMVQPSIMRSVEHIMSVVQRNKDVISKLPKHYFDLKSLFEKIDDGIIVYDEEKMTEDIDKLLSYEEYIKIDDRISKLEKEYKRMKQSSMLVSTIQNDINKVTTRLFTINESLKEMRELLDDYKHENDVLMTSIENLGSLDELKRSIDSSNEEIEKLNHIKLRSESYEKNVRSYVEELKNNTKLKERMEENEKNLQTAITDYTIEINELTKLKEEQAYLQESYEELYIMKESLSPTKGIPLLFIRLYMQNTLSMVNELLYEVYGGELEIEDFVINEKEFRIPYIKNGIRVSDVSRCSQGEESFVMIALSFALLANSIEDYDVILLDEVDGPLDINKRIKFISNLEKFLDIIGAEQANIISHNNVFDNYPVDIIRTSNIEIDTYRNANIIFSI